MEECKTEGENERTDGLVGGTAEKTATPSFSASFGGARREEIWASKKKEGCTKVDQEDCDGTSQASSQTDLKGDSENWDLVRERPSPGPGGKNVRTTRIKMIFFDTISRRFNARL